MRRLGVVASALLLPAGLFALDPGGLSPYGPAKWAAVSTVAAIGAALSLAGRPLRVHARATLAWVVLLGLLGLAAMAGVDHLYAWTGTPERNFGVVTWLLCGLAFLAGQRLDDESDARWVVGAGVLSAGALGAWAAANAAGWEPAPVAEG
ncbi:MAG: hypothetical protein M3066_15505, partial [Actinomycetota bacterium]|nr:hypothetical protein [Actinomycetota bacterium]